MSPERRKVRNLPTFEKLTKLFEADQRVLDNLNRKELSDGTITCIDNGLFLRSRFKDSVGNYNVLVMPVENGKKGRDLRFTINKNNQLEHIDFPVKVKIGKTTASIKGSRAIYGEVDASDKEKMDMAMVLVDWLENIIKENKYSQPPISISASK